ncbi:MFS transporter [Winkia neuii]|uniref:MFS transporter n=2 Tax=Winkia neuii TaxID=33007 RepID=UPI0007643E20|nr:MFS transporter [Winkia neuii]
MGRTFASLHYRSYRLWFVASLFANVGTWMQRVAQDWVVLTELTDNSGFAVGVTTALQFLPTLLFGAAAGVLADRLDRRKLLIVTQSAMGVLALAMSLLLLSGLAELWHLYVFAFLSGCVAAVDTPVRLVYISSLVPPNKLPNAVGLNSTSFNMARLVGPAVAGIAVAAVGPGWVFLLNALTFAGPVAVMFMIRETYVATSAKKPERKGMFIQGFRYIKRRSDIVVIMAIAGVVSAFGLNFQMTTAIMARVQFHRGPEAYGLLTSAMAVGTLTGALLAARRRYPRVRTVVVAALAFGVASGAAALAPGYWSFALLLIPTGLATLTMLTTANAAIQMYTHPSMRGRVISIYQTVNMGATPIGAPIVGWVAQVWGPRWSIGIGSLAAVAVAVVMGAWAWHRWQVEVHLQKKRPFVSSYGPRERADDE